MKKGLMKALGALTSSVLLAMGFGSCSPLSQPKVYGPPPMEYYVKPDSAEVQATTPAPADSGNNQSKQQ